MRVSISFSTFRAFLAIMTLVCLLLMPSLAVGQISYSIKDYRDGQTYKVVKIGDQWWMARNLNIGTLTSGNKSQENNYIIEKYCYLDEKEYCDVYGGLYQWNELMQYGNVEFNQGICPSGWHVSSDNEWKTLELYLGMDAVEVEAEAWRGTTEGGKLKTIGSNVWLEPNLGATDEVGFSAWPAGWINKSKVFEYEGHLAEFWCADEYNTADASVRALYYDQSGIFKYHSDKAYGHSARCIKDSPYIFGRSVLTDTRDDQQYDIVLIGNHWWMAENLNIGTWIDTLGQQKDNGSIEKYCYNNEGGYCKSYGGLYQWSEMMNYSTENKKGICPNGYHIPTDDEWKELEFAAGMTETDLDKTGWLRGTNEGAFLRTGGGSGFNAQLGGGISSDKRSLWVSEFGFLWASDQVNDQEAWIRAFYADTNSIGHSIYWKEDALSVRCVSDNHEILTLSIEAEESVCAGQEFAVKAKVSGGTATKSYSWTSDPPGSYPSDSIIYVEAQTNTKYTVRITDGYIYTRDSVIVNVVPEPVFTVTGDTKVCPALENMQYSVTENSDYSYVWSTTDGSITSTGQYNTLINWGTTPGIKNLGIQVTDSKTGCSNRKNISIELMPAPQKPVIMPKGTSLLICPDSGLVYQWYQNNVSLPGANKQFYYAKNDKSGSYTVETKLANQCRNLSDPYSFVLKSTDEWTGNEIQTVFIRPNPTGGIIYMDIINDYTGPVSMVVTNSLGRIVRQQILYKHGAIFSTDINLGELAEGFFFLIIEYGTNREVHRLALQK